MALIGFQFDSDEPPEDDSSSGWRRFEQLVPDVVKRGLITGVGALFMTEEGVRNALGDIKLPKEAVAYLMGQAERSKRDLTQALARELRGFLDQVDVTGVLQRVLAGMTVELKTEIRFVPVDGELVPKIKTERVHTSSSSDPENKKTEARTASRTRASHRSTKNKEKSK